MKRIFWVGLLAVLLSTHSQSELFAKTSKEVLFTKAFQKAFDDQDILEVLSLIHWNNVNETTHKMFKNGFTDRFKRGLSSIEVIQLNEEEIQKRLEESFIYEYNLRPAAKLLLQYGESTRTAKYVLGLDNGRYKIAVKVPVEFDQTLTIPAKINISSIGYKIDAKLNDNEVSVKNKGETKLFKEALKLGFNKLEITAVGIPYTGEDKKEIIISIDHQGLDEDEQTIFSTHLSPNPDKHHHEEFEFLVKK